MDFGSEIEDDKGYLDEQKGEDEEQKEDDLNEDSELEEEKDFEDDQIKSGEFGDDDQELPEEKEESIWDDIDWSEDMHGEREKTIWDDIDWSEDMHGEREKTIWDDIDWSEDKHGEREKTIWDEIDWSEDMHSEGEKTIWDDIDWSEDKHGEGEKNEKDKNDDQNEEYNNEDYVENVESQSTSTVLTNEIEEIEGNVEHQEQEEEIEIRPEECQNDTEPIINTNESEFIKDVEELAEYAREIKAEDEDIEPQAEQENAAYYAEQYYETLKEKEVVNDRDSKEEQETEELRQEVTEELKGDQESGHKSAELEEEGTIEGSKEITSKEEFEYLWGVRERLDREGKSPEEIEEVMHEAEEMYETLKNAEKLYEEQELEKLKLVDHEDEASEEDLKEELDRIDLVEQAIELKEKLVQQGELQEEIDVRVEESIETTKFEEKLETIIEQQELEKLKQVDHEDEATEEDLKEDLDRVDLLELAVESEEKLVQQGKSQEEIDVRVEESIETTKFEEKLEKIIEKEQESIVNEKLKKHDLEINEQNSNENVENKENLEVLKPELDAIESESEDNKDLLEEDTKLRSEESDEEEDERFQELYRQETGRRPIYARKKTKGYNQWLEQRELRAEKIKSSKSESEKKKEIKEEGWKRTLKQWIREASEEECNAELKSELKKALENYNEFEYLTRKFLELYEKSHYEKLSEKEKNRLKSLTERLQELGPIQLELLANIRAFKDYFYNHFWELMNRFFVNRVRSKFFKHISQKNKELRKVEDNWNEVLKGKTFYGKKKCGRCHKILSYNKFEKYGSERGKKEGKQSYRAICKKCRRDVKSIRALRKKLRLILELFGGKCNNCHTGLEFLPSFEFHHTEKEIKNLSWRNISQNSYQTLKKWAVNEKVTPLCGNCHSKEQAKYYKEFKNLILKKDLFKFSQEEIEELINVSIRNHPKFKNSKIKSKIKYQIKRWIRKRFVIEQLYSGKCIVCELQAYKNLPSMVFHHRNEKQKTLVWGDLRDLDCVKILKSLISENCVCICANCHGVLHSTFNSNIKEILKGILTENEINKFSSELNQILSRINNAIMSFKINLETIKFISPLKYAIGQNDIWKIKMLKIYSYLKQSEFRTKEIMSLCNNNYSNAYEIISKLVEKKFLFRVKKEGFTQNYYKFSEKGIKKVKELQQTYDSDEGLKSLKNKQIISTQRMENDDILEKYPKIIKNIIKNKGYNEFTVKELAEAIGKSTVNISRNLREKLIPNGYVKVKTSSIITKKYGSTKVYYLTDKTEIL